jgi:hypothetical protein
MNAFGIEIRRFGDRPGFFKEVDIILAGNGSGVSKELAAEGVAHALQKMINSESCFDVCTVRSCAELCRLTIPEERMNFYRVVHCIKWNQMLPDFRRKVLACVMDDFRTVLAGEGSSW